MKLTSSMGVAAFLVEMRFAKGEADRAVRLLLTVKEPIKTKPGCQSCWISRDAIDPCRIRYSEVWTSDSSFRTHVRSEEFRHVLAALDMCCEEPAVTIGELTGKTGMENLQHLLEGSGPDVGPAA